MTYIEFYDNTCIENICTCLTNPPDRVILVGDKKKTLEIHAERYRQVMEDRDCDVEFVPLTVNKNSMQDIIAKLSEIVETYDECVFDLTGGEDALLVATGIVYERYKDRNIQMHRINIRNGTVLDMDMDGETVAQSEMPELTVAENIRIYGGDIVYDDEKEGATYLWDFSSDLERDVNAMWEVCRVDVRLWNTQIGVFGAAELLKDGGEYDLNTFVSIQKLKNYLERNGAKYVFIGRIINALQKSGLIEAYDDGTNLSVTYKNEQVRRCLTKAGQALEMKMFVSAAKARDKDGAYTYNDVMNGVYIDWDGDIHTEQEGHDTENEIDVMMMHGMVPVFVSCKNGYVDMDELYKLNAVAVRFGGMYAKKVLIPAATEENSEFGQYLSQRAYAMNIRIVWNITDKNDEELQKTMRTLWNNN